MTTIIVGGLESATNADVLQGTRLQSMPSAGLLTFQIQASDGVAANNYTATVQLPGGDNPMNAVPVPAGSVAGLAGVIDERECLTASFAVTKGGHCVFTLTETGDAECSWRVTFSS